MITSRLGSNAQTTIPQAVRNALKLKTGDELAYRIEDGCVVLTRAEVELVLPPDGAEGDIFSNPFANFTEWDSEEDEKGYANL